MSTPEALEPLTSDSTIPTITNGDCEQKQANGNVSKVRIDALGDFLVFGWYTALVMLLHQAITFPLMGNLFFMTYGGYLPKVASCGQLNLTGLSDKEICALVESTDCEPQLTSEFYSVAYEFGYFCSSAPAVKTSISVQMIGVAVGSVICGQLSDMFGRRRLLIVCAIGFGVFDLVASYVHDLVTFTVVQFFSLCFVGGLAVIHTVYLIECVPKQHRFWIPLIVSFSPNAIAYAIFAYFFPDWRSLLRILSASSLFLLLVLGIVHESPRWLVQRGRLPEARDIYHKIERCNGSGTPERFAVLEELLEREAAVQRERQKKKKYYVYHLFYTSKMIIYSCILSLALFGAAVFNYGLLFNMEKLSGSLFVNNIIFGIIRYIFNLFYSALDFKCTSLGRKPIFNSVILFIFVAMSFVSVSKALDLSLATMTNIALLSATAMCSQMFSLIFTITSELFPTPIRNTAGSFVQVFTRLGVVIAPHLFHLAKLWTPLPYIFMALLALSIFVCFGLGIPETKGSPLSDHMPHKSESIMERRKVSRALRKGAIIKETPQDV